MKISLIAAMTEERVIGRENRLPWQLPEDLKRFRAITSGSPIVMGRKTYESIGRPLPNRRNIVLTRQAGFSAAGVECVRSLAEAFALCEGAREIFVIGGAEIYTLALPEADRIYLTLIRKSFEGDAFFPALDLGGFHEESREDVELPFPHSYLVLERK
ncbi:MAG: dihydrofolate reductase [Bdellovibrionota bacterium]